MSKNVPTFEVNMEYKEISKQQVKEIKSLALKKHRDEAGLFLVQGEKCVLDTLASFKVKTILCTKEWLDINFTKIEKYKDKISISNRRDLERISTLNSVPDIMAVYYIPVFEDFPLPDPKKFYVLLDEIQDPGNLGTIIRTCDWFGIYEIFASRDSADIYSPKVVQSSMGSLSRVKVHYLDLEKLINDNPGIRVIGTLLEGIPLKDMKKISGGFIIMGNEGRGISAKIKKKIDFPVTIPPVNQKSHPDSLNVAIALAIILSSFCQ